MGHLKVVTVRVPVLHCVFRPSTGSIRFKNSFRRREKHRPAWRNLVSVWGHPKKWDKTMQRSFSRNSSRSTSQVRHSTRRDYTRDAKINKINWEVQQDSAEDGKMLAHWLKTSQEKIRSTNTKRILWQRASNSRSTNSRLLRLPVSQKLSAIK